ncbi:MAG: helix-turn-helix domain-containing protein [Clostridium sp.]
MIKCRKKKLGISSKELSNKLGISPAYMSLIENKKFTNVKLNLLEDLSSELEINIYDLLDWFLKE